MMRMYKGLLILYETIIMLQNGEISWLIAPNSISDMVMKIQSRFDFVYFTVVQLFDFREIPLNTVIYTAPSVKIGALQISEPIKQKFNNFIEVTSDERPESNEVKLHMGIYYHCDDVWNPQIGDIRVQFYYAGLTTEAVCICFNCFKKRLTVELIPCYFIKYRHLQLNVFFI